MEKELYNINIHPELKNLIPPLTEEEYSQLEANCIEEGIREPLLIARFPDSKTAEELTYLADGHNRYEIAIKNNLSFNTAIKDFGSYDEIKDWMDRNQLGRRNLQPKHFKILIGRVYNRKKKNKSGRGDRSFGGEKISPPKTSDVIGKEFGVTGRTVKNAAHQQKTLKAIADETGQTEFEVLDDLGKDKVINQVTKEIKTQEELPEQERKSIAQIAREARQREEEAKKKKTEKRERIKTRLEKLDLLEFCGDKKYRVVYADPPWSYNDKQNVTGYGAVEDHYISMSMDELCIMPVKKIIQDNSILFLWTTSPLLEETFTLIKAWGFKYKTSFVWDKVKHNMGHYNSVRHEFLLICTKGNCTPDKKQLFDSVQEIEKSKIHSEKPEEFRKIIDTLYNWGNKIELFSRRNVEGWDVFGNQKIETL